MGSKVGMPELKVVSAHCYIVPGADLDTFSRVALKSDGVDFMYCIAYTMKIPSQPPKKPQLKLQLLPLLNMLNYFSGVMKSVLFQKKGGRTTCTDEVHFKTGQHGKKISNIPEKPKSPAF